MTIVRAVLLAALVAAASPVSAAPAPHAYSPAGIVTVQLAPADPGPHRPSVCTEQYAPVCARLNNALKTYSNQCYARAAGAEVIAPGPCTGSVVPRGPR